MSDPNSRQSLAAHLAAMFNSPPTTPAGMTMSSSARFFGGRGAGAGEPAKLDPWAGSLTDVKPWAGDSEDLRRRDAVEAARKAVVKPTRGAVLERAIQGIADHASGRNDPAVRLAAIEVLAVVAVGAILDCERAPDDPEDARESLDWRRACDDAYTDGIVARKCGLGSADHGLRLDTDRSRALASAYALGWSVADEAAAFEDGGEAARLLLKFGDADSRDALREALDRLPCRSVTTTRTA
mgnify:CR=1 FL=1